jgi:uncharacterized membrane protein YebE (DUF533 family)
MTKEEMDRAKAAAAVSAGAGVGGAGGATVGVLELAAQGAATAVSASMIIGLAAVAGGAIAYGLYRVFSKRKPSPETPYPSDGGDGSGTSRDTDGHSLP